MKKRTINVLINPLSLLLFWALLSGCATTHKNQTDWKRTAYILKNSPIIGQLPTGEDIHLGGFSGLSYLGVNETSKEQTFVTITDRGPNADLIKKSGPNDMRRPFVVPKFSPQLVFLETNSKEKTIQITKQISLSGPNGKPLTGLPPPHKDANGFYEDPVTGTGEAITPDLLGLDTECVAVDKLGNFWIGEEYRPSILSFSQSGRLVRMYVPEGYYSEKEMSAIRKKFGSSAFIRQILPKDYRYRRVNRGFEGLAVKNNLVIASLQSALDKKGEDQNFTRWITIDMKSQQMKEYFYPMNDPKETRIGDLAVAADGGIFVIEQTAKTGPTSVHDIYEVKLPETTLGNAMAGNKSNKLSKTLVLDMVSKGLTEFEKIEGLAVAPFNQFAVVNDNDFGLTFEGKIGVDANRVPVLTIFTSPEAMPSAPPGAGEKHEDSSQP